MVKVVKAPCYPIFSFFISICRLFPQHFIVEVDWQPFSDVPSKIVAFSHDYPSCYNDGVIRPKEPKSFSESRKGYYL